MDLKPLYGLIDEYFTSISGVFSGPYQPCEGSSFARSLPLKHQLVKDVSRTILSMHLPQDMPFFLVVFFVQLFSDQPHFVSAWIRGGISKQFLTYIFCFPMHLGIPSEKRRCPPITLESCLNQQPGLTSHHTWRIIP